MASQALGKAGTVEGQPIYCRWHWLYFAPSLALWGLIGLVLVVPRENRNPQAWLILIPLSLVVGLWDMPARLLSMPSASGEMSGFLVTAGAMGWSAVWLLGDRVATRSRLGMFLLTLIVMLLVGACSYFAYFGAEYPGDLNGLLIALGVCVLVLLVAMRLAAFSCGSQYRPGRFMGWLLLWTLVVTAVIILAWMTVMLAAIRPMAGELLLMLPMALVASLLLAGILYLVNLPFMILAFTSPFYGDRFQKLFHLREASEPGAPARPLDDDPLLSTDPTAKPVAVGDVVGSWQFYLDELASTVSVDFRPDGTFGQTIAANQGEAIACGGGTWRLEGAEVHLSGYVSARSGSSQSPTWWMADTRSGLALLGGDDGDSCFRMTRSRP